MLEYGNNEALLRQIASATGGRFNPAAKAVFDAGGRSIRTTMDLWPGLLALAILLNLAELVTAQVEGPAGSAASASGDGCGLRVRNYWSSSVTALTLSFSLRLLAALSGSTGW